MLSACGVSGARRRSRARLSVVYLASCCSVAIHAGAVRVRRSGRSSCCALARRCSDLALGPRESRAGAHGARRGACSRPSRSSRATRATTTRGTRRRSWSSVARGQRRRRARSCGGCVAHTTPDAGRRRRTGNRSCTCTPTVSRSRPRRSSCDEYFRRAPPPKRADACARSMDPHKVRRRLAEHRRRLPERAGMTSNGGRSVRREARAASIALPERRHVYRPMRP